MAVSGIWKVTKWQSAESGKLQNALMAVSGIWKVKNWQKADSGKLQFKSVHFKLKGPIYIFKNEECQ